jgi:5-methylcytosine-specific restriction protein A
MTPSLLNTSHLLRALAGDRRSEVTPMPGWKNSSRRTTLPKNWPILRRLILQRDGHQCTWTDYGQRCTEKATDVDHITPGENHSPSNLRSLCGPHHKAKSSAEGGKASAQRRAKRRREPEQHPSIIK